MNLLKVLFSPLVGLFAFACAVAVHAQTIKTDITDLSTDRYTLVDAKNFRWETGGLHSSGFIPAAGSNLTYSAFPEVTPEKVAAVNGQPLCSLSLWTSYAEMETKMGVSTLGNYQRSSQTFNIDGTVYVVVRWTAGGKGTTFNYVPSGGGTTVIVNTKAEGLINMSFRAVVPSNGQIIPGFVLSVPTKVLLRASGPGLGKLGVPGTLANPRLKVFKQNDVIAENDDWGSDGAKNSETFAKCGAFAFEQGSKDAAVVLTLEAGAYTAFIQGEGSSTGEILFEAYAVPN